MSCEAVLLGPWKFDARRAGCHQPLLRSTTTLEVVGGGGEGEVFGWGDGMNVEWL